MLGDSPLIVTVCVGHEHVERPRLEVDLTFAQGITAVMGPSGAGKTTLLTAVAGLLRPRQGRITLGERVLFDAETGTFVPPHERSIGLVFQSLALFPHLSAWENVAYGVSIKARAERRATALAWMSRTRVEHLAERKPSSLSGGEAQRVAIARALASKPRALLLDEPFSALDKALREELSADLRILVAELGIVAVLVTHNEESASSVSSRVVMLSGGRVQSDSMSSQSGNASKAAR
jgi:molybdate transport system ATP-binding protein